VQPTRRTLPRGGPGLLLVGRFFGVPLYFSASWVLIAALTTAVYSSIIGDRYRELSTAATYGAAFGFALALALCVLAHELGHTAVSLALGKPVRRVVIFFLGGVSEITGEVERARDELLIALAGPAVSGLVAGLVYAGWTFTDAGTLEYTLLGLLMWSNVVVAVFNLLPGLPLDGGRVVRALTWGASNSRGTGTRAAAWAGRAIAVLLVALVPWLVIAGWGALTYLPLVVTAGFIWFGATQSLRAAAMVDRLDVLRLGDLLRPGVLVHADVSIAEAVRRARECAAGAIVVIDRNDQPRALVAEARVREVPLERQPWTAVSEVARPLEAGLVLAEAMPPGSLLAAVRATPASEYLVMRTDGTLAGILATSDLAAALGPALGPR
jgi:Zn-dependent protease/CBS domain-containing protein